MRGFNTLHFEADPGVIAGLGPGGGGEMTPPAPDPEPQAPSWEGVTEEQFTQMQERLDQQSQMLEQLAPVAQYLQAAPQPQIDGQTHLQAPDPFSETYPQDLERYLEQRDAQRLAPYEQIVRQQEMEQLEGYARDMIHSHEQSHGELLRPQYGEGQEGPNPDDLLLGLAREYSDSMVQQFGQGMRADEEAIAAAYKDIKAYQDALIAAHEARQQNQMNALREAPREPGSSGIAAQPLVTTQPGGMAAFKARHGLT